MAEQYPWNSYSGYLEKRYGYRIWRVGIDAGFSCPNRDGNRKGGCVYCDALGAAAAYQRSADGLSCRTADIREQIERGRAFLKKRYGAEHFALYFQAFSNTYAPVEKLKEIYDFALDCGCWEALIVSTRPDCIDEEKCRLLASYKAGTVASVCVELGLQSGSDRILKEMNRGHTVKCFRDAAFTVKNAGLELSVHIIAGFPGEGKEELDSTVAVLNGVEPDYVKIHNLNIAKDTVLYKNYTEGKVRAPDARSYLETVVYILRKLSPRITVERLLCETDRRRLVSPEGFPDKNTFIRMLCSFMNENGYRQGDLFL